MNWWGIIHHHASWWISGGVYPTAARRVPNSGRALAQRGLLQDIAFSFLQQLPPCIFCPTFSIQPLHQSLDSPKWHACSWGKEPQHCLLTKPTFCISICDQYVIVESPIKRASNFFQILQFPIPACGYVLNTKQNLLTTAVKTVLKEKAAWEVIQVFPFIRIAQETRQRMRAFPFVGEK